MTSIALSSVQAALLARANSFCSPATLNLAALEGIEILSLQTIPRLNHTFLGNPALGELPEVNGLNFCNITVSYIHPGWNDSINVISWLPLEDWNGRFQANGGGGYMTGGEDLGRLTMVPGLLEGTVVSTTDGGNRMTLADMGSYNLSWPLSSPGKVNWPLLEDFASVSLHDMAVIGKALSEAAYGSEPKYSYFFGGSTGGRQGYMLAQRYPHDFNGIIALFPAINWVKFLFASLYPPFVMDQLKTYPPPCELEALRQAAIAHCDPLDGLTDGIVSRPDLCQFDPQTLVGNFFDCDGTHSVFSSAAATIASATWTGPRSAAGEFQWYGFGHEAELSSPGGVAATQCTPDGGCSPVRFVIGDVWVRYWIVKDPGFSLSNLTHKQWDNLFNASVSEYDSVIGTSNPDLSAFRKAGGKMISLHGTADPAIPTNGTADYYDRVLKLDPHASDFYRLFLAPGAAHGMVGHVQPTREEGFRAIYDWVEKGKAPDRLRAIGPAPNMPGTTIERDLCLYPRVQHYKGGDGTRPESFVCV